MTKSIQQIKQDLDSTESATAEIAIALRDRYRDYLDLLSQSVKQQLILASYQICTQFYPASFLALSLSNKQDLQQALRRMGIEIEPKLLDIIEEQELEPEPNELNLMAELIKNLPTAKKQSEVTSRSAFRENLETTPTKTQPESDLEANFENAEEIDLESIKAELANLDNVKFIEIETIEEESESESELEVAERPPKQKIDFANPEHLVLWHKQIERKIKKTLDKISKKVNKHLQDSGIIPDRIPAKIIDVALQTDGSPRNKNSRQRPPAPNILHLAIETDKRKKSQPTKNKSAAQISLLRLRLSEIEFSDPTLNAKRGQIRNLASKISKLNHKYQADKHLYSIAEAQAAWRSSWYED